MDGAQNTPETSIGTAPIVPEGAPDASLSMDAAAPAVGGSETAPGIVTTPGVPEYQAPVAPDASAADVSTASAPTPDVQPAPVDVAAPAPDTAPAPVVDAAEAPSVDGGLVVDGIPVSATAEPATVGGGFMNNLRGIFHKGKASSPVQVSTTTVPSPDASTPAVVSSDPLPTPQAS